jgi:hypothetical protein
MVRRWGLERARKRAMLSSMPGSVSIITRSGPSLISSSGFASCVALSGDSGTSGSDEDVDILSFSGGNQKYFLTARNKSENVFIIGPENGNDQYGFFFSVRKNISPIGCKLG